MNATVQAPQGPSPTADPRAAVLGELSGRVLGLIREGRHSTTIHRQMAPKFPILQSLGLDPKVTVAGLIESARKVRAIESRENRRTGLTGYWAGQPEEVRELACQLIREGFRGREAQARLHEACPHSIPPINAIYNLVQYLKKGRRAAGSARVAIWDTNQELTAFVGALLIYLPDSEICREVEARFQIRISEAQVDGLRRGVRRGCWVVTDEAAEQAAQLIAQRNAVAEPPEPRPVIESAPDERWQMISSASYSDLVACRVEGITRLSRPGCYLYQMRRLGIRDGRLGISNLREDGEAYAWSTVICHECPEKLTVKELKQLKQALKDGFQFPGGNHGTKTELRGSEPAQHVRGSEFQRVCGGVAADIRAGISASEGLGAL